VRRHQRGRSIRWQRPATTFDAQERAVVDELSRAEPGWLVVWSYGQQTFHAYPRWSAPGGLLLTDDDPMRLRRAMRAAQTGHGGGVYR
jgi:hypothetical protein